MKPPGLTTTTPARLSADKVLSTDYKALYSERGMRKTKPLANDLTPDHDAEELLGQHFTAGNDEVADSTTLLADALQNPIAAGSNEVHFEQDAQLCRIRNRVNGHLVESRAESATMVADLIKEAHKINTASGYSERHNLPLSNHGELAIAVEINAQSYRLNCSYFPTTSGQNLSVKISGVSQLPESLEQTTLKPTQIQALREHFSKSANGLTLVCSPNTSLLETLYYALLGESNCVEKKIVSLEFHSARDIPRINQLSLAGLDNADQISQLATRHCDKLYIDWQCATHKTLIKNVLTNYQSATVFICAQDSISAISQLTDYALNERQLATNLTGLIHLDSARMVCPHCANSHELSGTDMQWLENQPMGKSANKVFVYAPGCERCDYSGSQTSTPLMSVCDVDDSMRAAIETRNSDAIDRVLQQKLGKNALPQQIASLVSNGMVSFTEYKTR